MTNKLTARQLWSLDHISEDLRRDGEFTITGQMLAAAGINAKILRDYIPGVEITRLDRLDAYKLVLKEVDAFRMSLKD